MASLRDLVGARPGEGRVLVWSSAYYFLVLCAYYVLRPIRDNIGAEFGMEKLAWMFSGTLAGMLLVHPLYTSLVSKLPRRRFIPLTYRFFMLNLVAFYLAFRFIDAKSFWISAIFFVWTSVFNLFVVSVFWSMITDLFQPGQGKRLFGIVAVGGTLGAILGASITTTLVGIVGPLTLMLVSAVILEGAVQVSHVLDRHEETLRVAEANSPVEAVALNAERKKSEEVIGGGVLQGIRHVLSSPYLLGIAALMLFYTISSTFLYFQQADILKRVFAEDSAGRTRMLGMLDLTVNVLTVFAQLFVTGRVLRWLGVGFGLAFLPVVTMLGFGVMAAAPVLVVFVVFQVVRRAGNFAIQRPSREALFTVLPRTDKYKAKNFSDTFVYRLGDQVGAWSYPLMANLGLGLSALSLSMVPLSIAWLVLTIWLGRRYMRLEHDNDPRVRLTKAA